MGLTRTNIVLVNPKAPELGTVELDALADTGAVHMCIPAWVAKRLQLEALESRDVTLADGRRFSGPYVGPLEVRFGDRRCYVGAMVLGDEPLLGAIPMEDLDLVVHPQTRTVTVNPASPHVASTIVKAARGSCPVLAQP
jgi:clan AA aspartic protease